MGNFAKWFLFWIAKRVVVQGNHKFRITEYYRILIQAARNEFTEDNKVTLNEFLTECHTQALKGE